MHGVSVVVRISSVGMVSVVCDLVLSYVYGKENLNIDHRGHLHRLSRTAAPTMTVLKVMCRLVSVVLDTSVCVF
uniref:Putative secreted protein n=1 Tax=Anopheles darlingi TaxID=43151 RepID=A0A2M4DMP0_ANODA